MDIVTKMVIMVGVAFGMLYTMMAVNESYRESDVPAITMVYAEGRTCVVRFEGGNMNAECTMDGQLWWMCAETRIDGRLVRLYHCEEKMP